MSAVIFTVAEVGVISTMAAGLFRKRTLLWPSAAHVRNTKQR